MASHGISWVPDAHVRFGDLDFIVTAEGELVWAPVIENNLFMLSKLVFTFGGGKFVAVS